jgi:hypothetical protein
MTNYAHIEPRTAYLSSEFGEELARKWFGDESVDSLPRYSRGPRKGQLKGAITWSKVIRGGWVRGDRETASGAATGYVETRVGHIFDRKLRELNSDRFGTSPGRVIRDLEKEAAEAEYLRETRLRIDAEIRKYDMKRIIVETVILNDLANDVIDIVQDYIKQCNQDISTLCEDLK